MRLMTCSTRPAFPSARTKRPVALALTATNAILLIPELEREHADRQDVAAETLVYFEFPGVDCAFSLLARTVGAIKGDIAHSFGLSVGRAAELAGLFPNNRVAPTNIVTKMRQVKHPEELRLHREAARISDAMVQSGVDLVAEALRAGEPLPSEIELEAHVSRHALDIMESEHEEIMNVSTLAGGLVYGGPNSAYPHGIIPIAASSRAKVSSFPSVAGSAVVRRKASAPSCSASPARTTKSTISSPRRRSGSAPGHSLPGAAVRRSTSRHSPISAKRA